MANDILGKESTIPNGGKAFRNGMIIPFVGEFVISIHTLEKNMLFQGVGKGIKLVEKDPELYCILWYSRTKCMDLPIFTLSNANIVRNAGNVASAIIENAGQGYVSPTVTFLGANTSP